MFKEPISSLFAGTSIMLTGDQGLLKEDGCVSFSVTKRPYAKRKAMCDMCNNTKRNVTLVSEPMEVLCSKGFIL